jgi:hypothetical protein
VCHSLDHKVVPAEIPYGPKRYFWLSAKHWENRAKLNRLEAHPVDGCLEWRGVMSELQVWEQLLRIPELRVVGVEIKGEEVRVRAEVIFEKTMCPGCRRVLTQSHQILKRVIRHLPVCGRPCYIEFTERQFECATCGTFSPQLSFVLDQYRRHSRAYGEYLFARVRGSSIKVEAEKEGLSEKTLEEIYYAVARSREKEAKLEGT